MTAPSVLEWVIIGIFGLIVLIYCARSIYVIIDKKRNPEKWKKKAEEKRKKLDD